jgi:AraC-like DNA-binding protein
MLPYVDIFSFRTLLRAKKAWCPFCYEQWRNSDQVVYDPLLWNLSVISICPRHERPLQLKCPHCQQTQSPLAPRAYPGYCNQCSHWLGTPLNNETTSLTNEKREWQKWIGKAVGDLIAAPPNTLLQPCREVITSFIREYVQKVAQGNISEASRLLQAERRTINTWLQGTSLFTLEIFIRMCFQLRTTPLELLTGNAIITPDIHQAPLHVPGKMKKPHRKFDEQRLQRALEKELQTVYDVPPSMREVAQRLRYDPSHLYSHFPELCQSISARYLNYQKEKKAERLRRLGDEVRQAVYAVHEQGRYPSSTQVKKLLQSHGIFKEVEVYAVWRETLRELGWKQ